MVRDLTLSDIKRMFDFAVKNLKQRKDYINNLNVFPVPDGDCGTNMWHTLKSATDMIEKKNPSSLKELKEILRRYTLLGARGNSGVILSQFISGLVEGWNGNRVSIEEWCEGMRKGTEMAYSSLLEPKEGTILTVMRETLEMEGDQDFLKLFKKFYKKAKHSLKKTPELLPILKDAGVVDAGGQGFVYILEGFLYSLQRKRLKRVTPLSIGIYGVIKFWEGMLWGLEYSGRFARRIIRLKVLFRFLSGVLNSTLRGILFLFRRPKSVEEIEKMVETWKKKPEYRYCVEFIIQGFELPEEEIRKALLLYGDSLIVVKGDGMVKVHIHTNNPEIVKKTGKDFGRIMDIKIDDIYKQQEELLRKEKPEVIAVAQGKGFEKIFKNLGVKRVISKSPSVKEFLSIIENLPTRQIIILPNDPNIGLIAQEAAKLSESQVAIVPSKTIPEGICAMLAYNPENDLSQNRREMEEAIRNIKTARVVKASRDTKYGIKRGDIIGIYEKRVIAKGENPEETTIELIKEMIDETSSLISIYYKRDKRKAEKLSVELRRLYPGMEIQLYQSGDPNSFYHISVE